MVIGTLNYLASSIAPSLFRNGSVLTRRDVNGTDDGGKGVVVNTLPMEIMEGRQLRGRERPSNEHNGFELQEAPLGDRGLDFYDHSQVVNRYYPSCVDLVKQATGASFVRAFDHNIRSAQGKANKKRIKGGQEVQGPAHMVHGDYTLTSAPQRLSDLADSPKSNDTLISMLGVEPLVPRDTAQAAIQGEKRFAIINVWRNIGITPVVRDALALCDGRSVSPEDLVVFEIHYSDRVGENYFARPNKRHRWYTFSEMTRDEILLIKQWDSAGTLAQTNGSVGDGKEGQSAPSTFSFHSAFVNQSEDSQTDDRESIEVRCIVVYE